MDRKLLKNKEVGVAALIGAGIGAMQGVKNDKVVPNTVLGASVGALAGLLASQLFTIQDKSKEIPESQD